MIEPKTAYSLLHDSSGLLGEKFNSILSSDYSKNNMTPLKYLQTLNEEQLATELEKNDLFAVIMFFHKFIVTN